MADEITLVKPSPDRRPASDAEHPTSSPSDTTAIYRKHTGRNMAALGSGQIASAELPDELAGVEIAPAAPAVGTPASVADDMPPRLPLVNFEAAGVDSAPPALRARPAHRAASIAAVILLVAVGWLLRSLF